MSVHVEAIKFNHDTSSASHDAINLRRNAMQFVNVPEWRRGVSVNPEDSPAAYSKADTFGNTLTIQARFSRIGEEGGTVWIRAIDPEVRPPDRPGCVGLLFRVLWIIVRALTGNVLGEVREKAVTFDASGDTGFVTFELENVRLKDVGVGVRTTTWRWQYREQRTGPWIDMGTTRHRIYVLLAVPTPPWQQFPYISSNTQLPWTDVLDRACAWGVLALDRDQAAGKITQSVYSLGPSIITYDCPGGGSTHYAYGAFDCTAFLERLAGGAGNGKWINCTDCATFVSTFANILGCDLWQSRMESFFDLNPVFAIGSSVWQTACGWGGFSYHEVAWKGACTEQEAVFDACLQVDGDADPTSPPHTPLLPMNMRFGFPGDADYRDHLCPPGAGGSEACDPAPGTRQRRSIV